MASQSTLTSPLGTPVYSPREGERDVYASTSRIGRIVPLVVAAIGAAIIAGGAILYGAGVIGVPPLYESEEAPAMEPAWEPNPELSKALGVQALQNLDAIERRELAASQDKGSLMPPQRPPARPGVTVSPPNGDDRLKDSEMWEPPVQPKPPEGTEDLPKAADPRRTVPNGYAK